MQRRLRAARGRGLRWSRVSSERSTGHDGMKRGMNCKSALASEAEAQYASGTFRHSIGLPDGMIPEQWLDLASDANNV